MMEEDFLVMQVGSLGANNLQPACEGKAVPHIDAGPELKSPPMIAGRASLAIAKPMSARMP
eukprot:15404676-Heterocapsa_arctica.AAC.1